MRMEPNMPQTTNEMAINLPMISVPPMGADMEAPMPEPEIDTSVVVGSPDNNRPASVISVYADSITPSGSYDEASTVCTFDVVFNVGIREGDTSKTYRVVKRIGIDKVKLACDAECSAPVAIVEHVAEARKALAAAQAKRMRQIAGLE